MSQQMAGLGELLEALRALAKTVGKNLPSLLSKEEAARELGVGRTTLNLLIASGDIRTIRCQDGGHPKIPAAEIHRFIADRLERSILEGAPKQSKKRPRAVKSGNPSAVAHELERMAAIKKRRRRT